MNLEALVKELQYNPDAMKKIEDEVERLVNYHSTGPLYSLLNSQNPAMIIYISKILELRIKSRITAGNVVEEINFAINLLQRNRSYQVCEVYALLGLFCWPANMPSFFDDILSLLNEKSGYQIFQSFLEKLNTSTEIDDKRRTELKKAIGLIFNNVLGSFNEEFAAYIIPIFTELLRIIPKNFDFSMVYRKADQFPNEAIEFYSEGFPYLDIDKMVQTLSSLPEDAGLIQLLSTMKHNKTSQMPLVYEYAFRGIKNVDDLECFNSSVIFWQRIFAGKGVGSMIEPVFLEILKSQQLIEEDDKEDADPHIFGFVAIIAKNYPDVCVSILSKNTEINKKICSTLINKIFKADNGKAYISMLSFEDPYLKVLLDYLKEDPNVKNSILMLDLSDMESAKLAGNLLSKFSYSTNELYGILARCDALTNNQANIISPANEVAVDCYIKLGMHDTFSGDWNMNKVIRYYYFMKKAPLEYSKYRDSFYSLFISSAPFDRCFAIVEKLKDPPRFILENIYENLEKYPYIELCCFNNDLLPYMSIQLPFIQKEVYRFVTEWATLTNYKDYYQAIKSLLAAMNALIIDTNINVVDMLIDLIQIDCSIVLNRVLAIFNNYKGAFNTKKAVFHLITAYSSPNLQESQAMLTGALTLCMYQEDGPASLSEVLSLDINKSCEIRKQISKLNRRSAQTIIRNLLKDYKGKSYSKLYENDFKVTKQNFLASPSPKDDDKIIPENLI